VVKVGLLYILENDQVSMGLMLIGSSTCAKLPKELNRKSIFSMNVYGCTRIFNSPVGATDKKGLRIVGICLSLNHGRARNVSRVKGRSKRSGDWRTIKYGTRW